MDTYFVKDIDALTFCFHPEKSHIYYLKEEANDLNKQYIIEEDLLTFNVINKFEVIEDQAKATDPYGYNLYFYKKKQYLVLTYPSSLITIWDSNSKALLFKSYVLKKPADKITALALSESYPQMIFSMKNQIRLFVTNINEAITAESSVNFRKLKLPKKVVVNDIKCHPIEAKCAVACNDGFIRTWDLTGLNAMAPIFDASGLTGVKRSEILKMSDTFKLGLPSVVCISFSQDGTKLLSCNETGRIICWDVTNFGEDYVALASIRVSEKGILSSTWINYNGDYRSTKLLCYTQEGNIKLLELERRAEKRPDKKGVAWSFKELENIYHAKGGVYPEKLAIEPNFPNFIKTHPFSNLVLVNTLKEKKLLKQRAIQSKFSLSLKVLIIFDKMDHLLDYPKIAPSIHAPLNQVLFQPNKKSLNYLKDLFFVEDATLNHLNLSNGKKEIVIEFLKTPQLSDVIRTTRFELRPVSSEYVPQYTFLMNFQKEKYHVLLIATYNQESDPVSFKLYKEIPCLMSLFLGNTYLTNPPVYILGEDGMSYQLFIDDPSKLDEETRSSINVEAGVRDSLNAKIKKVYWTPFRNGYVVLYQTSYDNLLRFSMNRLPQNDILDYRVLTTDYVFKGQYDEDVFDVIWQAKSGLIPGEQYLGAVISWNKITIINESLNAITSIKIPYFNIRTNMLVNAFWFGYTLFYYTKNHLFYSTVNGKSNCLFSFDNYFYKNQILGMMNDRVVFGSKPNILNSKQAKQPKYKMEIRFRPLMLTEPILLGYLSLNKIYPDFQPDFNIVKHNFLVLETPNLSSELLKAFNEHQLFNASWFILANQNNVQFSLEEKIKVLNKLGQFEKFFEILFPGKYLTDEADVNEIISAILNNPVFHVEKKLLEKQAEVFINFGEFKKAVHCYDLLQEYQKISGLLLAIQEKKAAQQFTSKFLQENDTRIWNYNLKAALLIQAEMIGELMRLREQLRSGTYVEKCEFKITTRKSYGTTINFEVADLQLIRALRNLAGQEMGAEEQNLYNKVRQRYKIDENSMEPITKLNTSFGESAYSFSYAIRPTADDEEKLKSRFSEIFSMTPYQFLGYNCLEADETKKKMDDFGGGMEGYDDNGGEELGAIIIYWRCDEGKGTALENILGNNLNGTVEIRGGDASDDFWVPLEDGDPIELEDKWGKKCPPQFAISFKNDYNSIKCPKKNWYPGSLSKFTIELWLRPKSENGLILEVGQGNFVVAFSNSELSLQMRNTTIPLKPESNQNVQSDMDDDGSVAERDADEEANKIKSNFWNHISVVYDNSQQKKLLVYLNCVLIGSSESNLPNDLFRDQILTLGKEKLNAELTEFRFWTSALSLSEIKEQYRMPLEIVYEKKREIKVKFKAINKNAAPGIGLPQPGIGLPQPGIGLPQPGIGLPQPGMGLSLPEPGSNNFGLPPPGAGLGLPDPDQSSFKPVLPSPGDFQSFSTYKEERSPEKRRSINPDSTKESNIPQYEDESRKQDFTSFSNFDTHSKVENQEISNFNQFSNFGGEETKHEEAQPAASDFATFSDFNTVKVSASGFDTFTSAAPEGKFEDFKQWESTNTASQPEAQVDFGFSSFNQPSENAQPEKKESFGDFGGFDSFQNNRPSEARADTGFAQFNTFDQKPAQEDFKSPQPNSQTPRASFQNYGRPSMEGSDDKRAGGDQSISDHQHQFDMSYAGGGIGSHSEIQDISFQPGEDNRLSRSRTSIDTTKYDYVDSIFKDLTAYEVLDKNEIALAKDAWIKILENFYKADTTATIEAIYHGINLIRKQCLNTSKLGDKALLRKLQKLIVLVGRFRLATQILAGIQEIKQRENPSLRKLCFLCITLYSLKLNHTLNPAVLIEMGEFNLKAKNYKVAKQIFATLLKPGFDLTEDQVDKINEKNKSLETMPDDNQTLNKMTCPYCSQIFGFSGDYTCPHCSKDFVLCYQTMVCIDEESNIKCNACHATFSKAAKKPNEKCSVCSTGVLCIKK